MKSTLDHSSQASLLDGLTSNHNQTVVAPSGGLTSNHNQTVVAPSGGLTSNHNQTFAGRAR